MRKFFALLLVAALLAGVLSGCNRTAAQRLPANTQESTADPGSPLVPDFTVYDKNNNPVKFSDFRGKPVVLNFWATWCAPCLSELPHFQAQYASGNAGVEFMMINLADGTRETVNDVLTFLSAYGYTLPVYYDTQGEASILFGIQSIPATFFIDAEGHLVDVAIGYLSEEALQQGIDLLTK